MMMTELKNRIKDFIEGSASPSEFNRWFVAFAWDIHLLEEEHPRLVGLVRMVQGIAGEFSSFGLPVARLRDRLRELMEEYR